MLVRDDKRVVAMFDTTIDPDFAFATIECSHAVEELKRIKRQIKLLESSAALMSEIIKKEMGEKESLVGDDGTIVATYKTQAGRMEIDKRLLEEFYPEAYKDCLVKGKGFRSLLLK